MSNLASIDALLARLDFEPDDRERAVAEAALEDASELARHYGSSAWVTEQVAPPMVRTLVLRAAKRFLDNPQGYTTSRAGDETLMWHDAEVGMGIVHFDEGEQKMLAQLGGTTPLGFGTIPLYAWNSRSTRGAGYVPVEGTTQQFPLFASEDGPW